MFDDFRRHSSQRERGRVGGAMLAAAVLYTGLVVVVVRSTTAERAKIIETLTQVAFAPPPPPPPPAASPPRMVTPEPVQNVRAKVKRKELSPPDENPNAQPKEADGELATSEATGPLDGFLNGIEGGTGTEAAPKGAMIAPPLPLVSAVAASTNAEPAYSASAKRKEIEGEVVVVFDVLENGTVANIRVVSGPEELRDSVIKTVATWRFRPARRGDQPVRTQMRRSIRFELTE
jgi:protein TonB